MFRLNFHLKQLKYWSTEAYYLVLAGEQDLKTPQRKEFRINIAIAVQELDFYA